MSGRQHIVGREAGNVVRSRMGLSPELARLLREGL